MVDNVDGNSTSTSRTIAAAGSSVGLATIGTVQNLRLTDDHDLRYQGSAGVGLLAQPYPVSRAATGVSRSYMFATKLAIFSEDQCYRLRS